jgi:hypothetical protein
MMSLRSSFVPVKGAAPHGWPGFLSAGALDGNGLRDVNAVFWSIPKPCGKPPLCLLASDHISFGGSNGVEMDSFAADDLVNCGGKMGVSRSSSSSPSDISNIRSDTEPLPFSMGVAAGLLVSALPSRETLLRLRCFNGDMESSSKLCAWKEDNVGPSPENLFERTMASILARLPRWIFSTSSGYLSNRRAWARPLLAKGKYASWLSRTTWPSSRSRSSSNSSNELQIVSMYAKQREVGNLPILHDRFQAKAHILEGCVFEFCDRTGCDGLKKGANIPIVDCSDERDFCFN